MYRERERRFSTTHTEIVTVASPGPPGRQEQTAEPASRFSVADFVTGKPHRRPGQP